MSDLRYPVGKVELTKEVTDAMRAQWIQEIAEAPAKLRAAVGGLSDAQLDTACRLDGWTVRQVVHHVFDSHVNSYVRFKWALTEAEPAIKVYDQDTWAALPEARSAPVELSLACLETLHARWILMLRGAVAGRPRPNDTASRNRCDQSGRHAPDPRLARAPSHRAHHGTAGTRGVVKASSGLSQELCRPRAESRTPRGPSARHRDGLLFTPCGS